MFFLAPLALRVRGAMLSCSGTSEMLSCSGTSEMLSCS
jgi:hypothetical protein